MGNAWNPEASSRTLMFPRSEAERSFVGKAIETIEWPQDVQSTDLPRAEGQ